MKRNQYFWWKLYPLFFQPTVSNIKFRFRVVYNFVTKFSADQVSSAKLKQLYSLSNVGKKVPRIDFELNLYKKTKKIERLTVEFT